MDERERKMLAFLAGCVFKMATQKEPLDANEIQQVENIACELGYYDLEKDEFQY